MAKPTTFKKCPTRRVEHSSSKSFSVHFLQACVEVDVFGLNALLAAQAGEADHTAALNLLDVTRQKVARLWLLLGITW